jgi:hypothetical protein
MYNMRGGTSEPQPLYTMLYLQHCEYKITITFIIESVYNIKTTFMLLQLSLFTLSYNHTMKETAATYNSKANTNNL